MLTKRIVGITAGALLVLPLGGGVAWAAGSSATGPAPCTQNTENAANVTQARAALADAQSELDAAKTKLASAQDDLAAAKAKVTKLQAQIAALPAGSADLSGLQAQLSTAQSDVATKKAAVDKAQTAVNNAQCKVDAARAALARARVNAQTVHCTPAPTPTPAPETPATRPAPRVTHDQSSVTVVTRVSPTKDDNSVAVVSGHEVSQVPQGSASTGA